MPGAGVEPIEAAFEDPRAPLRIERLRLRNFRCFSRLDFELPRGTAVVVAENGGGKTALLDAIARLLARAFSPTRPTLTKSDVTAHPIAGTHSWEREYPCHIVGSFTMGGSSAQLASVRSIDGPSSRVTGATHDLFRPLLDALRRIPGSTWPVLAYYGTQRLWSVKSRTARKAPKPSHREDGYVDALDPSSKEQQLVEWLFLLSMAAAQSGKRTGDHQAFIGALATAASHESASGRFIVTDVLFDAQLREPVIVTKGGGRLPWHQLSDGYHVFLGLVADLARRCVTLNPHLGRRAVEEATGIVLIDEIELHLHPRWQRVAVRQLRAAFPRIQFIITTHSPQVLSSVENSEVIVLRNGEAFPGAKVAGRDSNAILREVFGTTERDEGSRNAQRLLELDRALDKRQFARARKLLEPLRRDWGSSDPAIVLAERDLEWSQQE